jgi:hypothetical protein
MRTSVILFLLLVCGKLNAQSFIEIIPTGGLDNKTCSNINNLLNDLNKGKTGQKAKYIFIIRNIYDENVDNIKTTAQNLLGPDNNFPPFLNFTIKSKESLIDNIISMADVNDYNIYYSPDKFNNLNSKQIINHVNQDKLFSSIKKNIKKKRVRIFYDNGFLTYAYSKERLDNYLKNNNCESLRPQLTNYHTKYQFRPISNYYQIVFDTLGFFDSYEIEIYKISEGTKKYLFHNTLSFSAYQDLNNDFDLVVKLKSGKGTLYLKESLLGENCVNQFGGNVKNWDSTCSDCQQECLYQKRFTIRIRGVVQDDSEECLWSNELKDIQFQCNAK